MWSDAARRRNLERREHASTGAACDAEASSLRLVRGCHHDRDCHNEPVETREYWSHVRREHDRHDRQDCHERQDTVELSPCRERVEPACGGGDERPAYAGPRLGDVPPPVHAEALRRAILTYQRTVLLATGRVIDVLA